MRRQVAANAHFWLEQISTSPASASVPHRERDNIVKALSRALQPEVAQDLALELLIAFHPYAERQGIWTNWQQFLEIGLELSQQKKDAACEAALLDRLGELTDAEKAAHKRQNIAQIQQRMAVGREQIQAARESVGIPQRGK